MRKREPPPWRPAEKIVPDFRNHAMFCKESLMVQTEQRELVPMVLSPGQVRLQEAIQRQRAQGRPVRIIFLKSRRVHITTGTAAFFFQQTAFNPGIHTVVLAHDAVSTENIFGIYERFHRLYKPWCTLPIGPSRPLSDRIYYEFSGDPESSFVQVHTAGTTTFGRSFRITNVHFSEFPYYQKPGMILSAIMAAVPKEPDTCAIVEGTAKTIGDEFHQMWQQAVDSSSDSEWVPVFMAWHEHPDNRMALSIPPDAFQDMLSQEEHDLKRQYNLSLEQLAWRRWVIANDFRGSVSDFRREHPATPEDAFVAASRNRFSVPHIQRAPIQRTPITGELTVEVVGTEPRIIFLSNPNGALRVYKHPEKFRYYGIGADPSGGADAAQGEGDPDPDWAVAQVGDRDNGEQVAMLRARMMPGEFGRYLYLLCRWYNSAQICLERTGAGVGSLEALLTSGYPTSLIYHRPLAPDQDPAVRSDKIGWNTDEISRQQALSLLDDALRQSTIHVHDAITQSELLTFIINKYGRAEAQRKCHDDTVLALAFMVVVFARMPRPLPPPSPEPAPRLGYYGRRARAEEQGPRGRIQRL